MKNQSIPIFSSCLVLLFLHSAIAHDHGVENEREFDYKEGSEKGPGHWGELKEEWMACKNGRLQSPIDLSNNRVKLIPNLGKLNSNYMLSNAILKNRGHDISLQWKLGDAGSIHINGTEYFLQQCHWHSPSEHTINDRRYELEMHMVHYSGTDPNAKNKIAVVGLLYRFGQPNPFISTLASNISSLSDTKDEMEMGLIDPRQVNKSGKKYYRYIGSLTTPPCTEGVIWTINKKVASVSREQVALLRQAVHDYAEVNARPLQEHNDREIHLYHPGGSIQN